MVALIMCLTIGVVLASYLLLIGSRYKIITRSQSWNAAVPVMEAGVEEAMTHVNDDLNNPSANGWTPTILSGLQVYQKTRSFNDGSYFLATIYNATSNNPIIYSAGFVPAPFQTNNYISRLVRVTGTQMPLIYVAFGAMDNIQMNGNGLAANSFNSSNPALSTNGQYDPTKTSTNGNVASVFGPVSIGNHSIAGNLYLGPTASSSVASSQVSGTIFTNYNVDFPDVVLPTTTWLPAPTTSSGSKGSQVHDFTASGDYYVSDSLDLQVEPGVTVRLRVDTTSFSPGNVNILTTNGNSGTLTVYQVSGSGGMAGNVTVQSGRARNLFYYGLPGVTSITYGGNSSFIGVIYAPEADLTLNGGGNNNGLIGASITKTITMNGHYNFHFDEDLLSSGPSRGFTATSWQEQ
ncbi:MAG TPA: collagen-binding domain-containing protein [Verrucomicrobiae bacterium]|nr:collagen-binding domain-containing protein [Verrucomicrobiae bacterium]